MQTSTFLALACATLPGAAFAQAPIVAPKPKIVIAAPVAGGVASSPASSTFLALSDAVNEPRIELDLNNTPIREALKQVFERAKQTYKVDDDVPDSARITVRAKNVRLSTALGLLLQDAGLGVVRQVEDGKVIYRIRKSGSDALSPADLLRSVLDSKFITSLASPKHLDQFLKTSPEFRGAIQIDPKQIEQFLRAVPAPHAGAAARAGGTAIPYVWSVREQRSVFQCPHCKGQATVIRKDEQPKCEKCTRPFQSGWQFCPADGTKRPATKSEWKFCPFCSKKVDGEKGAGIPILQDIPLFDTFFRNAPVAPAAPPAPPELSPDAAPGTTTEAPAGGSLPAPAKR